MNDEIGSGWSRFILKNLFLKEPTWFFDKNKELRAVRKGDQVEVTSRTDPDKSYTVDLEEETCTCPGFEYYGHCWHLEAAEFAEIEKLEKYDIDFTGVDMESEEEIIL